MKRFSFLKLAYFCMVLCLAFSFFGCFSVNHNAKTYAENNIDVSTQSLVVNSDIWNALLDSYEDYSDDYSGVSLPNEYCMRDKYIVMGENQASHGLCWAHAGNATLSTTLMKATGMYYDFSEGWVSTAFNYLSNDASLKAMAGVVGNYYVGGGGNFVFYDYLSQKMGVVLENDFTYAEYHEVSNGAVSDYYNFVSDYANKTLMAGVVGGSFDPYVGNSNRGLIIKSMKQHIMDHGSIYAGMSWGNAATTTISNHEIYYKLPNTNSSSGHAVSIIGWDDDITIGSYTGAWIILNSWGDDAGDNGIYYVTYDDADIYELYGYKYEKSTTGNYFYSSVQTTSAEYTTNLKGAYYNNFSASTASTEQKNIFYTSDVNLTYNYSHSKNIAVTDIEVLYFDELIDTYLLNFNKDFDVSLDVLNKTISINGESLKPGAYKVVIKYLVGSETKNHINTFYVMDGTELNYINYNFDYDGSDYVNTNAGGSIYNNGFYGFFDDYNDKSDELVVGTSNVRGVFIVAFLAGTYSTISSIEPTLSSAYCEIRPDYTNEDLRYYCFNIYFNTSQYDVYPFKITTKSGTTRIFNIRFLPAKTSDIMVNVLYNTNGGENSQTNLNRVLLSSSSSAKIAEPTKKWHTFLGWYTDKALTTKLTKSGDSYLLPYGNVKIISNPVVDSSVQTYFNTFHKKSQYVHLYAKWERTQITVTFVNNNGTANQTQTIAMGEKISQPAQIQKTGHTFAGWYADSNFETLWDFNNIIESSITIYAKWDINKYNVTYNYNNGQPSSSAVLNYGEKIVAPSGISLTGYSFDGWYADENFTSLWNFNTPISGDVALHAKWSLVSPTNVTLSCENDVQETITPFEIFVDFQHPLKNSAEIVVEWYRNGVLVQSSESLSYNEKLFVKGTYKYTVKVFVLHGGNDAYASEQQALEIVVNERPVGITNIRYCGEGNLDWVDSETGSKYIIYLFKVGVENYVEKSNETTAQQINFHNAINSDGQYFIVIEKYLNGDLIGGAQSHAFEIVKVDYQLFDTTLNANYGSVYLDKNATINRPINPVRENYIFTEWYNDDAFNSVCNFPMAISNNTTLYAHYTIKDLQLNNINNHQSTYQNGTTHSIIASAEHQVDGVLSYKWYKFINGNFVAVGNGDNMSVCKANDSGTYYVSATLIDQDGFAAVSNSNVFSIEIEKAETQIDVLGLEQTIYTYNGEEQTILGGASLNRNEEIINLVYRNNTFTNVPNQGFIDVEIFAAETENYKSTTETARVVVNKKQSSIQVFNMLQEFVYQGQNIMPEYWIDNSEQNVICNTLIKDVGQYSDVTLTALESQNYLSSSAVVTVEVTQATIIIKAKDVTSFWLFGKKDLEYEISGEYYGGDINVKLLCEADIYKPGEYKISISIDNPNYKVQAIEGIYTVTAIPYYAGLLLLALLLLVIFTARSKKLYYIDFEENGGSVVPPIEEKNKKDITIRNSSRQGYVFDGWYLDSALTKPFDNNFKRGKNLILYAKWIKQEKNETKKQTDIEQILQGLNIVQKKSGIKEQIKQNIEKPKVEMQQTKTQNKNDALKNIISNTNCNKTSMKSEDINSIINKIMSDRTQNNDKN